MTFSKNSADVFALIPDILLREPNADMLMVYFLSPEIFVERVLKEMGTDPEAIPAMAREMVGENAKKLAAVMKSHGKPIIGFTYRSLQESMLRTLLELGIPIYQDPERAARSISTVLTYYRMRDEISLSS